jgi:hypothetical protein
MYVCIDLLQMTFAHALQHDKRNRIHTLEKYRKADTNKKDKTNM